MIGIKNAPNTNTVSVSTIADATPRLNLLANLSTKGFKEQAITYDAKNNIAKYCEVFK